MHWHSILDFLKTVASVIATASIAANFLPPASTYDAYPRFRRFYETFIVKTFAAVSLSLRAQYPSLAIPLYGLRPHAAPEPATTPTQPETRK